MRRRTGSWYPGEEKGCSFVWWSAWSALTQQWPFALHQFIAVSGLFLAWPKSAPLCLSEVSVPALWGPSSELLSRSTRLQGVRTQVCHVPAVTLRQLAAGWASLHTGAFGLPLSTAAWQLSASKVSAPSDPRERGVTFYGLASRSHSAPWAILVSQPRFRGRKQTPTSQQEVSKSNGPKSTWDAGIVVITLANSLPEPARRVWVPAVQGPLSSGAQGPSSMGCLLQASRFQPLIFLCFPALGFLQWLQCPLFIFFSPSVSASQFLNIKSFLLK